LTKNELAAVSASGDFETKFVRFHIHLFSAETHAFGFEAEALLEGMFTAQLDFASCAEDALPGKPDGTVQDSCDLAGGTRKSSSAGYCAVG
jgi:hypothetical protein